MNCHKISPPSSKPNSRPQTVRSRASSSPGLDNAQIYSLLNKKSSFASLLCKNSDNVESDASYPPTRSMSVISVTSVLSPSSIDTVSSLPRLIRVAPARDSASLSSDDSALVISPRKKTEEEVEETKTVVAPIMKPLYIDEIVWQIDDIVFASGIDAATNMSLLCRLNIEFVCEINDEATEHLQQSRRVNRGFDCPCLCPRQLNHFRYFVNMDVPESEQRCIENKTNMQTLFNQFNELVDRGKKAGKNVLVCSSRGRNRAPSFCAAYLMVRERISRGRAVAKVCQKMGTMRPPVNISDFMQRSLMRYQTAIGVEPEPAYDPAMLVKVHQHAKRSAWT